jgi:hypothetical protein
MIFELAVIAVIASIISSGVIFITLQGLKREKATLDLKSLKIRRPKRR